MLLAAVLARYWPAGLSASHFVVGGDPDCMHDLWVNLLVPRQDEAFGFR